MTILTLDSYAMSDLIVPFKKNKNPLVNFVKDSLKEWRKDKEEGSDYTALIILGVVLVLVIIGVAIYLICYKKKIER